MTEDGMKKVRLGRTDLMVTPICFGTSALGHMPDTYGYDVDSERARATIGTIFDGPVNFLDTSRIYGMGHSEERIGAVIRERGGLPPGFVVSTKLDRDPETNVFDAAQARRSLEQSLKALGLERIDVLHLHDPEHSRSHNRFTLANRNAEEMLNLAKSRGIAVLNAAPYAGGVLAKGSSEYPRYVYQAASDAALDPIRRIEAICARHRVPPGAAALQFSMRDPRVASTICGVTRPERVRQTLDWARFPIPEAMWEELKAAPASTDDPEAMREYRPG